MDFETAEHILLPILTLAIGAFGTWLTLRTQGKATLATSRATARDDERDDFETVSGQAEATIKRLDDRVKRLEDALDKERERRVQLEMTVARLNLIYRLLRRSVLTECDRGKDCPLWRYLDDKERDEMVASLVPPAGE